MDDVVVVEELYAACRLVHHAQAPLTFDGVHRRALLDDVLQGAVALFEDEADTLGVHVSINTVARHSQWRGSPTHHRHLLTSLTHEIRPRVCAYEAEYFHNHSHALPVGGVNNSRSTRGERRGVQDDALRAKDGRTSIQFKLCCGSRKDGGSGREKGHDVAKGNPPAVKPLLCECWKDAHGNPMRGKQCRMLTQTKPVQPL
mmetsp:Transcript_8034/g.19176  ORF Transcript_8034/g.19176 Transcript_8034/m.19176 type:complete len:201 (+) Transcript_8034:802-1404(+)